VEEQGRSDSHFSDAPVVLVRTPGFALMTENNEKKKEAYEKDYRKQKNETILTLATINCTPFPTVVDTYYNEKILRQCWDYSCHGSVILLQHSK